MLFMLSILALTSFHELLLLPPYLMHEPWMECIPVATLAAALHQLAVSY